MDIKIVDVASKANVSPATVSRVLNGHSYVKSSTREKVMRAIESLGYHPNAVAKNLRSQRSMTIGVIVPDINASYFAEIIKGIENMAYSRKYRVIICDAENQQDKEMEYLGLLMSRTVDGMILVTPSTADEEIVRLTDKGYEVAVIGRAVEHPKVPCIFTDNVKFSKEVVDYLVSLGHRDIVFLSGYANAVDSFERLEGYLKGLKEHHIPFRPELVENGNFNERGGYEAMKRLLDKGLGFTAVYAANDEMALGVYKACDEAGLRIPEQLSVVGVDNNRISKYITPALTTVNQPKYAMGAVIAEKLIDQMNADEFSEKRVFKVDSELIVRQSSGSL
ncbi:LacI family DNA-binding transcriptional regulator [Cohnella zeiphila]|uniref:LacI family DNA-binding transcriptional regulator n=1 Tax=Cohnella zeiphila TaxID=2761120 RepID=A0A7X0VYU9_9BACL|nr:LacI family DNA-binding transcriptional regulator [Cohnella zeiphila]MBB6734887.1 LacI family DNA-binding transcriptional regulator [Cohnella zeiphila]